MRMAQIGHIEKFNRDTDDWSMYIERVQFYFNANGIPDAKKKAALLSLVGPDTFKILSSLLVPERPADKSYEELKEILTAHFCPRGVRFTIGHSFTSVFRSLACQSRRTCQSYSQLQRTVDWRFSQYHVERPSDLWGVHDPAIRKHLLEKGDNLTFKDAVTQASTMSQLS